MLLEPAAASNTGRSNRGENRSGIETREQAAQLRAIGADMGQGFLFSRPLRPHLMEAFLDDERARRQLVTEPPLVQLRS